MRVYSRLIATHSLTSTYLGGATMVLNEPLTSAALTKGWQRKSGFGPVGEAGWPLNSAPGDASGASYCWPPGMVSTGERLGARRRLHVSFTREHLEAAFSGQLGSGARQHSRQTDRCRGRFCLLQSLAPLEMLTVRAIQLPPCLAELVES